MDVLKDAGPLRARGRARTDSTRVIAAVRRLNRTETVGEGLRVALEGIAAVGPGFIVPLPDVGRHERYGHRFETARLLGRGSSETSIGAPAGQVGADGKALLDRIDADRGADRINRLPAVRVLRALCEQQFTAGPGGAPVLKDAAATAIQHTLIARDPAPGDHLTDAGYPSAANIAASNAAGITPIARSPC